MKSIVVYFARDHKIDISRTERLALKVQELTGSDIYKIVPLNPYPFEMEICEVRAKEESQTNAVVEIEGALPDLSSYDVIYLGYPNWYRSFPRIIGTFLDNVDVNGKIIKPFVTHVEGGSGISELELKGRAKGATIKGVFTCQADDVDWCDDRLKVWINK